MNNKGFLLAEETLKIIIALISITFLVYFLVALYTSNADDKNLEFAESSLNYIVEEIDAGSNEIEIYNPDDWVLISWPYRGIVPNSCSNVGWNNCLCICKDLSIANYFVSVLPWSKSAIENLKERCDKKGVCKQISFKVEGEQGTSFIALETPIKLNVDPSNNKITK